MVVTRSTIRTLGVLFIPLLLALPVLTYPLGRDQGEFAVIARGLLEGKTLYVDLWNPKPPAIFGVYALALAAFGQTTAALRVIDLIAMPMTAAALYWIGVRLFDRRIGLWAALLFPAFYFSETFWTLTQNDGIVLLPMCLAAVCTLKAAQRTRRAPAWSWAAGALLGVVWWFKYPFALFAIAIMVLYAAGSAQRDSSALRGFFLGGGGGGLFVLAAGVVWLVATGAWDAFIESVRVTASYTALGLDLEMLREAAGTALGFRWSQWGLLFVLALVGSLVSRPVSDRAAIHPRLAVLTWLAIGLAIMAVQLRGYDYHWLPMLPPLALLGALGITRMIDHLSRAVHAGPRIARRLDYNAALIFLLLLAANTYPRALPYLTGQERRIDYADRFVGGEVSAGESLRVAEYLRARNVPGDSLYIWGFRPEVYFLSDLRPPTRFIFHFPLVAPWYPPEWRKENVEILWAALPPYVLVLQVDYMPWVTGREDDSNSQLQEYTELNDWLMFNYERETQIGNFFVWKRKSQPG